MKMIFVLIILAVILLTAAIVVFFWAVKSRQFDDLDVHAYDILKDDKFVENLQEGDKHSTQNASGKSE